MNERKVRSTIIMYVSGHWRREQECHCGWYVHPFKVYAFVLTILLSFHLVLIPTNIKDLRHHKMSIQIEVAAYRLNSQHAKWTLSFAVRFKEPPRRLKVTNNYLWLSVYPSELVTWASITPWTKRDIWTGNLSTTPGARFSSISNTSIEYSRRKRGSQPSRSVPIMDEDLAPSLGGREKISRTNFSTDLF